MNEPESAYEIAVNNGFRGTEAEWLASLKGDKGEQGDDNRPSFQQDITNLLANVFKAPVESEFDRMWKAGKLTGPKGDKGDPGDSVHLYDLIPVVQKAMETVRPPKIEVGAGKPPKDGVNGDLYINKATGDLYQWV